MKGIRLATVAVLILSSLVLVPNAAAGGGCHTPAGASATYGRAEAEVTQVSLEECLYGPTVLYVNEGTKVTWTNEDPAPHSITGALLAWGSTELLDLGESAAYRFEEEGVYPYYCVLHPGMAAAVVVGDPGPETTAAIVSPAESEPPASELERVVVPEAEQGGSAAPLLVIAGLVAIGGMAFGAARRRRTGEPASA